MINNYINRFVVSKLTLWNNSGERPIEYEAGTIFFIKEAYIDVHDWIRIKFRTTDFIDGAFNFELRQSNRLEEIFDFIDDPGITCENKCCCEKTQEKIDSLDRKIEILLKEISSLKSPNFNQRSLIEETEESIRRDYVRHHGPDTSDREYTKWQLKNDPDMMAPWLYDDDGYLK